MSTEFFNDQWRIPSNENQNKVSNYSMNFDGTNDFITIDNSSEALNPDFISISAWFYPTSSSYPLPNSNASIISSPNRGAGYHTYDLGLKNNGTIDVILFTTTGSNFDDNFPSAGTLNLNQWNFICMTYDGANVKVTVNTTSQSIARPGGGVAPLSYTVNPTGDVLIGRRNNIAQGIIGSLDQVAIFNYALSSIQITTLYDGTAVTNPMSLSPAPIAYYQLGDQSVSTGATEDYLVPNNSLQDYVFNFSNDEINCGNSSSFTFGNGTTDSPFSVSFWINPNSISTGTTGFFQKGNDANIEYGILFYLNKIRFRLKGYDEENGFQVSIDEAETTALVAGSWNHVVVTYDGTGGSDAATGMEIYINKNLIAVTRDENEDYVAMSNKGSDLFIASRGGTGYVAGKFSNFAVFNTELNQTKVTNLYNNGSPSTDISSLNPTAWYKLNAQDTFNGTNWTIKDYAGTNNGTSSGMNSANLIVSDLQHTSGYSPYAITLDGTGQVFNLNSEILLPDNKTVSFWFKLRVVPSGQFAIPLSSSNNRYYPLLQNSGGNFFIYLQGDNGVAVINTFLPVQAGVWYNFIITGDGTTPLLYINNVVYSFGSQSDRTEVLIGDIGARPNGSFDLDGDMSNVAIWSGTTLSSTEVTEVYNQGVPSNLNTFSGTKPTAWWQLGSNSSFNSATSQWTCLDEIGTNNAASSTNMANDDITNGVGYSANGLGTSSIDIIGNAPYSSGNGLSENMDVLDRVKDTPPT